MDSFIDFLCCGRHSSGGAYGISGVDMDFQRRKNREIERAIKLEKRNLRRRQRILLLGTGESGKSTFLKQMKIIHGKKFSVEEVSWFRDTVRDNIYKGVLFMLQARQDLSIQWQNPRTAAAAEQLEAHFRQNKTEIRRRNREGLLVWEEDAFLRLVPTLAAVWKDEGIKATFRQRAQIMTESFSENTRYYLDKLNVIGVRGYTPTNEDIVWSRKPTESIIEESIEFDDTNLVFIDVGGQTKERRKWCQCFSDMTSVLFLIACSHYDERYQDKLTKEDRNKLHEAMVVFEGLVNHWAFAKVSIMIFFNKYDVLKEKIASRLTDIRSEFDWFPRDMDPFKLEDVENFMVESFVRMVRESDTHAGSGSTANRRMIYRHFTTAVDTNNIKTVFHSMKDTVLQHNLRRIMMS